MVAVCLSHSAAIPVLGRVEVLTVPEPYDLDRYLRLRKGVESYLRFHYPGDLERLPEAARRAYLRSETLRIQAALSAARRQDPTL